MNISEIKADVVENWTDPNGLVCLHPAKGTTHIAPNFDSENQLLFSGQYIKLLSLLRSLDMETYSLHLKGIQACQIEPGLFNRHPGFFDRTVSHDEMNGLCYASAKIAKEIVEYGKAHSWAFINENPGAMGFQLLGNNLPLEDGEVPSKILPYVNRVRQPRDRFFYKKVAGEKPSLFETLNFCAAILLTLKDPPEETSGKIMYWFKFKSIDSSDSKMLQFVEKKFFEYLKKQYGEFPLREMYKIFFKEKEHPFHKLAEIGGF